MIPRYYQQAAHDAIIDHARKTTASQVCVLPTGAGKSHVIAMVAKTLYDLTGGKRILCTAPNADLVIQNRNKFKAYGFKSSVFCASAGSKSLHHDIVFGSPLSLFNSVDKLEGFAAIIIDEADLLTKTIRDLIANLKTKYPRLCVIGLTATPYRLTAGMGYIYAAHYRNGFVEETNEPYFDKCTYEISAHELIAKGFLTKPLLGKKQLHYETDGLILLPTGKFDSRTVDEAFLGKGRLTSDIVADVVETTQGYNGVLLFASTIAHAEEIMASLPPDLSGIVHSKCPTSKKSMNKFAKQRLKYLVNVDCLTVGIDWPHVDCIALLRRTESSRLLQQIIGRGLRLYEGKRFCLILDYAGNNAAHFPNDDPFDPKIKAKKQGELEKLIAVCPQCNFANEFAIRPNDAGYDLHPQGFFVWPDTKEIVTDKEARPIPSHFGRRCKGLINRLDRCTYKWTFKICEDCGDEADISARYCKNGHELIDPNEKLMLEKRKIDERVITEPVLKIELGEQIAKSGTKLKTVDITTLFNKRVRLFLRMAKPEEREQWRKCRDLTGDAVVSFMRPAGQPYYKFVDLQKTNH